MSRTREKFATQVNSEILSTIRAIAEQEGRQLQALVDEALADLIEKRKHAGPDRRLWLPISPAMTSTASSTRSSPNE